MGTGGLRLRLLFVPGYPMAKRPFYTHPDPTDPAYSNSFDLIFRGMELVTGGQRLHRHADYVAALERARLPLEPFAAYLEAMRYGMPPHGGFAIGLERFVMQLAGLATCARRRSFRATSNASPRNAPLWRDQQGPVAMDRPLFASYASYRDERVGSLTSRTSWSWQSWSPAPSWPRWSWRGPSSRWRPS